MTKVDKLVNFEKILIKMSCIIKVKPGKDYFYFYDCKTCNTVPPLNNTKEFIKTRKMVLLK